MAEVAAELDAPDSGRARLAARRRPAARVPPGGVDPAGRSGQRRRLQGPIGIHLLMVCDRREPQGATPQREQIAERLERERVDRLARRYLRDLRKEAFVEVRL